MTKKLFAIALITVMAASVAFAAPMTTAKVVDKTTTKTVVTDTKTVVKVKKHHKKAPKKVEAATPAVMTPAPATK